MKIKIILKILLPPLFCFLFTEKEIKFLEHYEIPFSSRKKEFFEQCCATLKKMFHICVLHILI